MRSIHCGFWVVVAVLIGCQEASQQVTPEQRTPDTANVGPEADGHGTIVSTRQLIRPAGQVIESPGRPVDLIASADGKKLYVKDRNQLNVIDVATWKIVQSVPYPKGGASMHGIALSGDGKRLYVTTTGSALHAFLVKEDGCLSGGKVSRFGRKRRVGGKIRTPAASGCQPMAATPSSALR